VSNSIIERVVRNRVTRVSLATALIALSLWAFLPYVNYRIAPSAFVNAELVRVTAPIAGRLAAGLPPKGTYIEQTTNVALIESLSPDRRHLLDLQRQHAVAGERAELARRQTEEISRLDDELLKRMEMYRTGIIKRLGNEIAEAEGERKGCLAEADLRREVSSGLEQLAKSGIISRIRSSESLALKQSIATKCEMAEARTVRLKGELESAVSGIYLRDSANDVTYSQQQRDRLVLRRQELERERLEEESRAARLSAAMDEEKKRLAGVGEFHVELPRNHILWSVAASPGSTVVEGQTILDLADCGRRFVVVNLPERDFEEANAGDPANVRLIGSDEWRRGVVRQVRGSAARADDRLLAAQVLAPGPGSISVDVALPPDERAADRYNYCDIGRLAEVRFERSSFSFVRRVAQSFQSPFHWLNISPAWAASPRASETD
jgi:multidrug resistance efflux pump